MKLLLTTFVIRTKTNFLFQATSPFPLWLNKEPTIKSVEGVEMFQNGQITMGLTHDFYH